MLWSIRRRGIRIWEGSERLPSAEMACLCMHSHTSIPLHRQFPRQKLPCPSISLQRKPLLLVTIIFTNGQSSTIQPNSSFSTSRTCCIPVILLIMSLSSSISIMVLLLNIRTCLHSSLIKNPNTCSSPRPWCFSNYPLSIPNFSLSVPLPLSLSKQGSTA